MEETATNTRPGTLTMEGAEKEIDTFIERRAREAQEANHFAEAWAEGVRAYTQAGVQERRAQWLRHHRRMVETHTRLIEEHQRAIAALTAG